MKSTPALSGRTFVFGSSLLFFLCLFVVLTSCKQKDESENSTKSSVDSAATQSPLTDRYWNDVARYLGGLKPLPGSTLDSIDLQPDAQKHRNFLDTLWPNLERNHLAKFRTWADRELGADHKSTRTVLYPFSGADFLHVHTLYPNANTYIMYGLEREGTYPDVLALPRNTQPQVLINMQRSLGVMLNMSFFRTIDMQRSFNNTELLSGTAPVLLAFLARTGNEVLGVQRVRIDRKGKLQKLHSDGLTSRLAADGNVTGMEIRFRKASGGPEQKVQYFCFDAQDLHVEEQPYLLAYFKSQGPTSSYFKSASYLMHWDTYSMVRDNILSISDLIVQDDTGIALRKYDSSQWNFSLYGNYIMPVREFTGQYQKDLAALFQSDKNVKPLDFGIGYHNELGRSNLIVARKKAGGQATTQPAAQSTNQPATKKP